MIVLTALWLSPLGPLAVNTMAPDEGDMYLLGKVGPSELKQHFLAPMIAGDARSAFFMTEPDGATTVTISPAGAILMRKRCAANFLAIFPIICEA